MPPHHGVNGAPWLQETTADAIRNAALSFHSRAMRASYTPLNPTSQITKPATAAKQPYTRIT